MNDNQINFIDQEGGLSINPLVFISAFFSRDTEITLTRIVRGTLRTGAGAAAIAATGGAGGDVIVNSAFAVQSSVGFSKDIVQLMGIMNEMRDLFNKLFYFTNEKIPIRSKLLLDMGLQQFRDDFLRILSLHIRQYSTETLNMVYHKIIDVMDRLTTVLSDWLSTLFPDTAGLVGEVVKTILDYVVRHGFTFTYNLISMIPPKLQQMLTNPIELKIMIAKAIDFLENIIKTMNPTDMIYLVKVITDEIGKITHLSAVTNVVGYGVNFAAQYAKFVKVPTISPIDGRKMIVSLIDRYVRPNINYGVDLFDQLLPVYFMFVLFMEEYPKIAGIEVPKARVLHGGTALIDEETETEENSLEKST